MLRREWEARTCISCHEDHEPGDLKHHPYYDEDRWCAACLTWWRETHEAEYLQSLAEQAEENAAA